MIEIENVGYRIGEARLVDDVSLTIPKGGVTALIGPNGAGKSTLLSLMARLLPLQTGRIAFDGMDVARTPTDALALKLAIQRQDTLVASRLTVRDLVGFGRYPHHKGRPRPEDREEVEKAIAQFDLEPMAERFIDELSGGERQRAFVAMTFCQGAEYLLLDEPLNNLDMRFARALMRRLREAAEAHGRTIIVVLHEINYAAAHADRIIAMKQGRVVAVGTPEEILTTETLGRIYDFEIEVTRVGDRLVALHHG